jgi:hypothetical protein
MRNIIEEFGNNAGKIWKELELNGSVRRDKLIKKTGLNEQDFSAAVGWLARENKILTDGAFYKIGETNLNKKIGEDAGKIWKVLNIWGEVDLPYIYKLAGINKTDMYFALGWLAREGKLYSKSIKPVGHQVKFKLK